MRNLNEIKLRLRRAIDLKDDQMYRDAWEEYTLLIDERFDARIDAKEVIAGQIQPMNFDLIWRKPE